MQQMMNDAHFLDASSELKLDDVHRLLEAARPAKDKLNGMKRLLAMVTRGVDASAFFADVVKNVVTATGDVKKLVYMFLVHYAESQPDLALLAINNFQKDLSDQNQLIRALALRVMSSIRVPMIAGLQVLAVKKCASDTSPYVRKTAALAIAKCHRLDEDQLPNLVEIISTLLGDRSTMVLGAAVAAYWEVCPEQYELLHPHYRKLCHLLADIDEWGQILLLNVLISYSRTQFVDPLAAARAAVAGGDPDAAAAVRRRNRRRRKKLSTDVDAGFYSDEDDADAGAGDGSDDGYSTDDADADDAAAAGLLEEAEAHVDIQDLEADHRLLLKAAGPLLQSRNSGVVLGVATLFAYLAPWHEVNQVGKSLVRIMRSNRETAYTVLANTVSLASTRPGMFRPHLKQFFVHANDAAFLRPLKLEVLTLIANESNISVLLREFKEYVKHPEQSFVTATVQAIGRCAVAVPEVAESCLHGLMSLLSNPSEAVVAEAVVVVKTLLQKYPVHKRQFVSQVVRLLDAISVVAARQAIVWMIGEYSEQIPLVAPDALRKLAKSFPDESDAVKLQVLNLGAKLQVTNPAQTRLLFDYVMALARFDTSYDVRDRARILNLAVLSESSLMTAHLRRILLPVKPAPGLSKSSSGFASGPEAGRLGTLSHLVGSEAPGAVAVPAWATAAADASLRDPIPGASNDTGPVATTGFGRDSGIGAGGAGSGGGYGAGSGGAAASSRKKYGQKDATNDVDAFYGSDGEYSSGYGSYSGYYSSSGAGYSGSYSGYSDYSYSDSGEGGGGGGSAQAPPAAAAAAAAGSAGSAGGSAAAASGATATATGHNLMDLDMLSSLGAGAGAGGAAAGQRVSLLGDHASPRVEVLNSANGGGITVEVAFTRAASLYGASFSTVRFFLTNATDEPIAGIKAEIGASLAAGQEAHPFSELARLAPGVTEQVNGHYNFAGKSQPIPTELVTSKGRFAFRVVAPTGELVRAPARDGIDAAAFDAAVRGLGGMHEASSTVAFAGDRVTAARAVLEAAGLDCVGGAVGPAGTPTRFAGSAGDAAVYVSLNGADGGPYKIVINCDNALFSSTLEKAISDYLRSKA
jgi:AP-3 complex subunit beta